MIRRIAAILGMVVASAACAPDSETSPQVPGAPPLTTSPAPAASSPAGSPTPAGAPADADDLGGKDSLSGTWKFVMGSMTWTVRLAPRPGLPGEYLGLGERETRDEHGKAVTMEVAAVVENGNLRAWLGLGVIKCTAPFRPAKPTEGTCIEMGGNPAGPFRAERITTGTP
jgi:hypothetical protein